MVTRLLTAVLALAWGSAQCAAQGPATLDCDVAVIGGGSAGFGAAWSAAHLGSAVVLVEREAALGGTSTLGGVNNWEPGMGGTGVPYRVYQRLTQTPGAAGVYRFDRHLSWRKPWEKYTFPGGMIETDPCLSYAHTLLRHGAGMGNEAWFREHCHGVIFEPDAMADVMLKMLQETGRCRVLLGAPFREAQHTGGRVSQITLSDGTAVRARVFIDATDGALCARLGCDLMTGRDRRADFDEPGAPAEPAMRLNGATLVYRITPLDKKEPDLIEPLPEGVPEKCWWQGGFPVAFVGQYPKGDRFVNMLPTLRGEEYLELGPEKAYAECRRRVLAHWHWYQKNYDEFRRFKLKMIFPVMGVRETRRVRGEYVLTQRDLIATLANQKHSDIIAIADHPMDNHGGGGPGGELKGPYGIPYRCLLPLRTDNVLIAGRAASFSAIRHAHPGPVNRSAKMIKRVGAAMILALCCSGYASTNNPATDWFSRAGYGVFVHYLNELQNNADTVQSLGRSTTWDECVKEFDTERFAAAMSEAGAGYVIFTTHQRSRFLIAPNAAFDRLTGYRPGEACATRDLIEDLYQSLHKRNIPLMLYWTGNGPSSDAKASAAMGWQAPVTLEWLAKWAAVTEEYALRYGDKVAGWWVDGCYAKHGNLQYDDEKLGILARALKAGNTRRIIGLNPGVELTAYSRHEDFTAGEQNRFHALPVGRWLNGEQWHVLSYLGADRAGNYLSAGWCEPGVRYSKSELAAYIFEANSAGGTVSIDVLLYRDGGLDRSQLEVLKTLRPQLATMKKQPPVPPGNLAFRKPSLLLSLDGLRELPVNGGGNYASRFGVDGNPGTAAMASMEWPWTYEADLLQPFTVRRVKVTFSPGGYATQLRIQVSPDRSAWQTVATAENLTGKPFEAAFASVTARYVRVSALKPNGPDQPGKQMAVAELEVYE